MKKTGNSKQEKFEAALEKYSSMLSQEYKDQFKKVVYAGKPNKNKDLKSSNTENVTVTTQKKK